MFLQSDIEQCSGRGDSLVVHDVELGLRKRRRDLVLHDLYAGAIPCDNAIRLFDRADAPNIDPDTRVEFQRLPTRRRLRIPKHHANFFADLICENAAGPRL